ncbi:MAG: KEOPS complex subunit Cgi121 [Nitrososphaeraceae archaeon]
MKNEILKIRKFNIYIHTAHMKENIFSEEFQDKKIKNGFIQVINSECVYNHQHIIEILKLVFELKKRNIMYAKKIEIEFLLRIAGINQIKKALFMTKPKINGFNSIILVSSNKKDILKMKKIIEQKYGKSKEDIFTNRIKKQITCKKIGLQNKENKFPYNDDNESNVLRYLIEKAVLVSIK